MINDTTDYMTSKDWKRVRDAEELYRLVEERERLAGELLVVLSKIQRIVEKYT